MLISTSKDLACVAFGDEHIGGNHALAESPRNPRQEWIRDRFDETYAIVNELAFKYRLRILKGGDTVHLPGNDDWRAEAERLLQPWVDLADGDAWGVPGTPYHVGPDGADDRAIYRGLGIKAERVKQHQWIANDGEPVDWSHHGVSVSKKPANSANGMVGKLSDTYFTALAYGERPPAALIRHHAHQQPFGGPVRAYGIWGGITGCWAAPDDFAAKVAPGSRPNIGVLVWIPREARMYDISYVMPREVLYS